MSQRSCCICQRDLTDTASIDAGIGPICRKMSNKLLAQSIPADRLKAQAVFELIDNHDWRGCIHVMLAEVEDELGFDSDDWRGTVKRIEWLLSWSLFSPPDRMALIRTVELLGYTGLGSLLRGEASTGKAQAWFADGRLWIAGSNQKAGREAIKKLWGRKFHPKVDVPGVDKQRAAWSVPANHVAPFAELVTKHWPMATGMEDACQAAATTPAPDPKLSAKAVEKNGPAATVTQTATELIIEPDYCPDFITGLKALVPYKDRKWDSATKAWRCAKSYKAELFALISTHFVDVDHLRA